MKTNVVCVLWYL